MYSDQELQDIAKKNYTLFFKYGCQYSKAALKLLEHLKSLQIIDSYKQLILGEDYTEEQVTGLCAEYNVFPQGYNTKVPIPQIIMKGEFIGGNDKFYGSRWNLGEDDSGTIVLYDENGFEYSKSTPCDVNPTLLED